VKRSSRLQIAEHCGYGAVTEVPGDNEYSIGGRAFHAGVHASYRPDDPRAVEAYMEAIKDLSDDEIADHDIAVRDMVAGWRAPDNAEFEVPVGLSARGGYVPYDDARAIVRGTADIAWIEPNDDLLPSQEAEITNPAGVDLGRFRVLRREAMRREGSTTNTLYVVDLKMGPAAAWTVPPPGENLQLASYGFALADRPGPTITEMRLGIYLVAAKKFVWARFNMGDDATEALWRRVRAAALRDPGSMVIGSHCMECRVRRRCPAYLIPAVDEAVRRDAMMPMFTGGSDMVTDDHVVKLLVAAKALGDMAEMAREWAKNYVATRGGKGVVDADRGMVWSGKELPPRRTTSVALLEQSGLLEEAERRGAIRMGEGATVFAWRRRSTKGDE